MSNHVGVLRHMKNTVLASPSERKALDAAIAALSAPQAPAEAQPCGCGEATCTVPWEPGCGLGKSEQHAEAQAQGGGEIRAKPLEWQQDGPSEWCDRHHGFHITQDDEEPEESRFTASWGEGDPEFFPTLDEAQAWCQESIDRYIREWAVTAPQSAPVGVEASQLADELEAWAKEPFVALTPMRRMDIEGFANRIRAIAKQPAAVTQPDGGDVSNGSQQPAAEGKVPGCEDCAYNSRYLCDEHGPKPAAVDESLPDFLDRIAGELVSRDTRAGTIALGIAESLRGRAIVLRTLAAQPGGSDNDR